MPGPRRDAQKIPTSSCETRCLIMHGNTIGSKQEKLYLSIASDFLDYGKAPHLFGLDPANVASCQSLMVPYSSYISWWSRPSGPNSCWSSMLCALSGWSRQA